jgi:hypothetical protein
MKKTNDRRTATSEYDFSKGRKGTYAARYAAGTEIVLDPNPVKGPDSDQPGDTLRKKLKKR